MNVLFTVVKSESAIKLIEQCNQGSHNGNLFMLSIALFQIQVFWPFEFSASLEIVYKFYFTTDD